MPEHAGGSEVLHRAAHDAFLTQTTTMRLSFASLACCVAAVSAEYLSEGWKPGQAPTSLVEVAPQFTPGAQPAGGDSPSTGRPKSGLTSFLTEGPVGSLLEKFGVNLSSSLAKAEAAAYYELWDKRIPLIHDDNYEEVIVNEPLTPEEEAERVWFLIMYACSSYLW